jgi:glycosyltransferase involved in cell wall biosynthesis
MWFWEGATLPEEWLPAFDRVDELWLASNYLADVFGQYERVPVHVIGLAADLPEPTSADRAEFGLNDEELVFLFVFDAQSVAERKNPDLALMAFEEAFGRDATGVRFYVKTHNLHKMPGSEARLRRLEANNSSIKIVNEYWSRDRLLRLMQVADIYVSPHAAEGFGLTLLESMSLGTPVISTGFSGNMDFTTEQNSWLLDFELTRLSSRAGPYPAGTVWARPSIENLVETMRSIASERSQIEPKAKLAREDAVETSSLESYASRLDAALRRVL